MLNDKQRWWAEFALDVLATAIVGWLILGSLAAAFVAGTMIKPDQDPGDLVKFLPVLAQVAVTWGMWKVFRHFDWLNGTPPPAST